MIMLLTMFVWFEVVVVFAAANLHAWVAFFYLNGSVKYLVFLPQYLGCLLEGLERV